MITMSAENKTRKETTEKQISFTFSAKQAMFFSFIVGIVLGGLIVGTATGWNNSGTVVVADSGGEAPAPAQPSVPSQPTQPSAPALSAEELADDDPVLGDPDAPLTIVEFSDFQCPFCSRAFPTVQQILEQYDGQVKVVYRDFPLTSIHPMAQKSAEAAECADEQGQFKPYHDILFERQATLSVDNLKLWAGELGLDTDQFNDCLDSGKYTAEVQQDARDAQAAGGRGTPYFVVGTTSVSGAQPFSNFQAVIEAELAK